MARSRFGDPATGPPGGGSLAWGKTFKSIQQQVGEGIGELLRAQTTAGPEPGARRIGHAGHEASDHLDVSWSEAAGFDAFADDLAPETRIDQALLTDRLPIGAHQLPPGVKNAPQIAPLGKIRDVGAERLPRLL